MGRSLKKGDFTDAKLLKKVATQKSAGSNKPIKTWSRRSTIHFEFVGHTFNVHNGKQYIIVAIGSYGDPAEFVALALPN
mgnify:CR=1 FL=1